MPRIEIVSYDLRWPGEFARIAERLRVAFGSAAHRIDHIGSTSVPELTAKDVIDIQITVRAFDAPAFASLIEPSGYAVRPDIDSDHVPPGGTSDPSDWTKLMLVAPETQRRTNVHIRQVGRANQRYPLLFRDYLRAHPAAVETYRAIKIALARLHPDDMDAYYEVKDPVCDLIIDSAERWASQGSWAPGPSDA